MKFPAWAKTCWWVLLLVLTSAFLYPRHSALASGSGNTVDVFLFIIWISLCLLPLFSEMSLFGVTLKKEVETIKAEVKAQGETLRAEMRSVLNVRSEVSNTIAFPPPPPDSQLQALEERVQAAVETALRNQGLERPRVPLQQIAFGDDVSYLFWARYSIEKELRRLWSQRIALEPERRPAPVTRITASLVEAGLIEPRLGSAIREVYAVCSPAIHGEDVTPAQVAFVRDVAPGMIMALKAI